MSTLRERVDEVLPLLNRHGVPSIREWCRLADVQESYLNRRMHAKGDRPDFKKFESLAHAARDAGVAVDARWLAFGEGAGPVVSSPAPVLPEPRVEREDTRVPEDDELPLETALFAVYTADRLGAKRYATLDFDAARSAIRSTHRKTHPDADLEGHAARLLEAARQLRTEGIPTDTGNLMQRAAVGKTQRAKDIVDEVSAAFNEEADAALRAKGYEPGVGRAKGEAMLAAQQARKERRGQ